MSSRTLRSAFALTAGLIIGTAAQADLAPTPDYYYEDDGKNTVYHIPEPSRTTLRSCTRDQFAHVIDYAISVRDSDKNNPALTPHLVATFRTGLHDAYNGVVNALPMSAFNRSPGAGFQQLEGALNTYLDRFEQKHGVRLNWWVSHFLLADRIPDHDCVKAALSPK